MESPVGLNTQPVLQEQRWIFSIEEMLIFNVFQYFLSEWWRNRKCVKLREYH